MTIITAQLEVLETCSAPARPHAFPVVNGVVHAGVGVSYQGTGMSFAGDAVTTTPRLRKGGPSGTTTWSPPV